MQQIININLYEKHTIIDNNCEILKINYLVEPLTNIPSTVKKIYVECCYNVFKRQHEIPKECELFISGTIVTNYIPSSWPCMYSESVVFPKLNLNILNKITDDDFSEITQLFIRGSYVLPYEKFINLTILLVEDTIMTNIPEDIKKLSKLKALCIFNSKLTDIPEWISELTELTDISFANNNISSVSETICSLPKLTRLNLSKNQITLVPETLRNKPSLKYLMLDLNPICPVLSM